MELYNNVRVVFKESTHCYFLDGKKVLTGVTSLMKKHGLSPDYSDIDEETLRHAAELGTAAHKQIENYCDGLPVPDSSLIRSFKKLGLNIYATEYLISDNELVASSIDLVNYVSENEVELIDMKRTDKVHTEALRWQLGIYKYLFEDANPCTKVIGCYCLPIKKGDKDSIDKDTCKSLVKIEPQPDYEVERLLDCEKRGMIYEKIEEAKPETESLLSFKDSLLLRGAVLKIAEYESALKAEQEKIAELKDALYEKMLEGTENKIEVDGLVITLKRPYKTQKFNSTKFKKDHPELAVDYTEESEVKGSISFKIQ